MGLKQEFPFLKYLPQYLQGIRRSLNERDVAVRERGNSEGRRRGVAVVAMQSIYLGSRDTSQARARSLVPSFVHLGAHGTGWV